MALISLADMYDKWKKVSDWVTGVDTTSSPKVQLTGSLPGISVLGNATITDTANHYYFNDVNFPTIDLSEITNGNKMIYIRNGGTQAVIVNIFLNPSIGNPNPGINAVQIWTGSIAAGDNSLLTLVDIPELGQSIYGLWMLIVYPVASASGVFYSEVTY